LRLSMETYEDNDDEWEFDASLTTACELESLLVNKGENTEKNHWINSINEVQVSDETTRDNKECKNYKAITTEKQNKPGGAYIPPPTKLPMSFLVARSIGNHTSMHLLRVLFDSGGSCTWINSRTLPRSCTPGLLDQPASSLTLAGKIKRGKLSSHQL
jgi:hypothetical protein